MADFAAIRFTSWSDLFAFGRGLGNWFYRGQSDSRWRLKSSLERAIGVNSESSFYWQHAERWMLGTFRGFAHNFLAHPPANNDLLEWLALMQHHGAPTRLLDCTFSFPVAAFFAAWEGDTDFAIWAFNWTRFRQSATERFGLKIDSMFVALDFQAEMHKKANQFLKGKASGALTFPTAPPRSSERLEAQQGMFLFPCDINKTLEENLVSLIGNAGVNDINDDSNLVTYNSSAHNIAQLDQLWLLKLVLPKEERLTVLRDLRTMNIDEAVLFPGLDGFAKSLRRFTRRESF